MSVVEFETVTPPLERDHYKRPKIVTPDGELLSYTRASTVPNRLEDGSALKTWWGRNVALGVARSEDLAAMIAGVEYGDPKLDEWIEEANSRAGGAAKANWGTAVHRFTEPDAPVEFVPARMTADVDAYQTLLSDEGIEVLETELFVVNDQFRAAGTLDHLYRVPGVGIVVGDKKTGKYHPNSHAMQLAIYAGGVRYAWHPEVSRSPLVEGEEVRQDVAVVVHMPAGKGVAELKWVSLEKGRRDVELSMRVQDSRAEKAETERPGVAQAVRAVPFREARHVPDAMVEHIGQQLAVASSVEELTGLWIANQSNWTEELTSLASARKALLVGGLA